jgi:hypothetical protein
VGLVTEHRLGGRIRWPGWLRWFVTFHLVVFGWILFRSENVSVLGTLLSRLVAPGPATLYSVPVVLLIVAAIGLQLVPAHPLARLQLWLEGLRPAVLGAGLAVLIVIAGATVSSQGVAPFIYFRF